MKEDVISFKCSEARGGVRKGQKEKKKDGKIYRIFFSLSLSCAHASVSEERRERKGEREKWKMKNG